MTEANFDAWIEEVRRKVTDLLDAKPVDGLSDTEIKDKDGVAELGCVIDTIHVFYTLTNRWTSSGGVSHSSERLHP